MPRWIVDGNNVFGSRPDGWWRDRDGARRRLLEEVVAWRAVAGDPVLVVFDGHPSAELPEGTTRGVHVLFARSSARNAADDRIAAIVEHHPEPTSLVVVTSDGPLRDRISAFGAGIEGAGTFLDRVGQTSV